MLEGIVGLRMKLIAPILLLGGLFLLSIVFYWVPNVYEILTESTSNKKSIDSHLQQLFILSSFFILSLVAATLWLYEHLINSPLKSLQEAMMLLNQGEAVPSLNHSNSDIHSIKESLLLIRKGIEESQAVMVRKHDGTASLLNELRKNQLKDQAIFENIQDGILIVNSSGSILGCNPAILKMTGFEINELIDEHFDLLLPDSHNLLKKYNENSHEILTFSDDESLNALVSSSGIESLVELSIFHYKSDKDLNYVFMLRDNNERHLKERLLKASEDKLRTIIENAGNIICTMSLQNTFTFLSPAWHDLLGYSISDALGQSLESFALEADRTLVNNSLQHDKGIDNFNRFEFRIQHKSGEQRWFTCSGKLVRNNEGEAQFFVIVLEDVTERKGAMQALAASEERFRLLFDSMSHGVVVVDGDGTQLVENQAVENILGIKYSDFIRGIESGVVELINEKEQALSIEEFPPYITMRDGTPIKEQLVGAYMDEISSVKWIQMNSVAMLSKGNRKENRVFITFTDITEHRLAEFAIHNYVHYLNVMERVNEVGLQASSMDEMFKTILQYLLTIFDCNRAWLIEPCDMNQDAVTLPMICDSHEPDVVSCSSIVLDEQLQEMIEVTIKNSTSTVFTINEGEKSPQLLINKFKSSVLLTVAIFPKTDEAWLLCMDYTYEQKGPSKQDRRIFENVANRLADYITSFQSLRNLLDSGKSLKEAQKISKIGDWSYDLKNDLVYWSEQVYRIIKEDSQSFSPQYESFLDVIHPDDYQTVYDNNKLIQQVGGDQSYDFRIVLPENKIRWVHAEVLSDTPNGQKTNKIRGTYQDITQNKLSEEQLKQAENQMRMILESAAEGIFGMDVDGKATFVNSSALKMLGYESDEMVGKNIHQLIHHSYGDSSHYPVESCPFQHALTLGHVQNSQNEVLWRKDGTSFQVEYSVMPIQSDKDTLGAVVTFRDISEQIIAGLEKTALEVQLQQAQKMDAIGQLTGGIAHDFNNMLASILGYSELALLIAGELSNKKLSRYLEEVFKAGERGRDLIDKMLAFSRGIDSSKPEPILLEGLLIDVIKMLRSVIPTSITINTKVEDNIPAVMIDTINLQQIVMNLCINARDAMEGEGVLNLEIRNHHSDDQHCSSCHDNFSGDFVELIVTDNGSGIDNEFVSRMFDPFFTTKEVGKGTGMGLSVVHGIVHSSGGHIHVDSTLGEGTSISIFLPPTDEVAVESTHAIETSPEAGHSGSILIVDDEPSVGTFLKEMLQLYGYECTYLESPVKALALLEVNTERFQLVISDVTMPDMTGIELASAIKSLKSDLPVILCTGYSEKLTPEISESIGVFCVLKKPLNSLDLLECVGEAIDA